MMIKNGLVVLACLASATLAQVESIFCQARYITNVATCIIGVKECNTVERFSSCVCANTGQKDKLRMCLIALLHDPMFMGTLQPNDFSILAAADATAVAAAEAAAEATPEAEKHEL
ncbi:hypothetical protein BGZ70_005442 [Mortierella alpina]|uniref:Extracellular membrane protein CFEM domain-containing protein n=1 Tax=Mortierella alpina TaxID=64518 RepID=A0A9P6JED7_MORAP|nr:hypothetical protein BGZ70_005442 [Mortierella alpina]